MAVKIGNNAKQKNNKKTSIGRNNIKRSSMNKTKKRAYKKYRGQGK